MSDQKNKIRESIANNAFKNKTVVSVDCCSVNTWKFTFSDNSTISLWAEDAISTPCGNIAGIFLEEELGGGFGELDIFDDEDEILQDE